MSELTKIKCLACKGGVPPLKGKKIKELHKKINPTWKVIHEHHLEREFKFKDYKEALFFVNRVGELAERENHHPEILLTWGKVVVKIWTHKIDGLFISDFILAAKIDKLSKSFPASP